MKPMPTRKPIEYPDDDGNPMAENTLQFQWIVTIKENLEALFADDPGVFVAGDLLWYPVEGHPEIRQAPDALVAFGRPKGYRGSYKQWEEDGIAPQAVFEVLSPGNRPGEMTRKFKFYEHHGIEEYYVYDPDHNELTGWVRKGNELQEIAAVNDWVSPRLGIRFELNETLTIRYPDGAPFLTVAELVQERDRFRREFDRVERDLKLANWEKEKALAERAIADSLAREQAEELSRLRVRLAAIEPR